MGWTKTLRSTIARILAPEDYYEAAQYSRRRSLLPGVGLQSARFDISSLTLDELRKKARYWERNSPIVNRIADIWEQYTVGTGIRLQPATADLNWNREANNWWNYWSELPDIATRQHLQTCLSLGSRAWCIDGECFFVLVRGQGGIPRLQMIEAHLVRTPNDLSRAPDVVDGVRVDLRTLRPLSYFVHWEHPTNGKTSWEEVDARQVIHLFEPSRPGQLRGIPMLHAALNVLHDLEDLHTLEMSAAKDAAKTSKVIKRAAGNEFNAATLTAARIVGKLQTASGSTVDVNKTAYYDDVLGEGRVILQPGDDYQQFKSDRPSVVTRDFWRYLTEQVCAAVGVPYVLVFPDSMQGTVYRGALDSAAAFFACRSAVVQAVLKRIYLYAMGWARYTQPALVDGPSDWQAVRITQPRAVNVDVGRNSRAELDEIAGGAKTFSRSYGAQGLDSEEELRQRAKEAKTLRDLADEFKVTTAEISNIVVPAAAPVDSEPSEEDETVEEEMKADE